MRSRFDSDHELRAEVEPLRAMSVATAAPDVARSVTGL